MPREIVQPRHLDLTSPGRRDYWVSLEHDTLWGAHLIPLTVIVGPKVRDGEGLVAFGANHGNEYEGPVAIRHLLTEIDSASVIGRLILVPILNPAAFRAGKRDSDNDDAANLNRAFVDGAGEQEALRTITFRIAAFVRRHIWPHAHAVIDLHAGGQIARFALGTSFHEVADPTQQRLMERIARSFGLPLVIAYQNETPGLLTSEAEQLGKIAIGAELGWGGSVNHDGVRHARHGVIAAAVHLEQMDVAMQPIGRHADGSQRMVAMINDACFTIAQCSGHFEPLVGCGAAVNVGDVVGLVHDFERIDMAPWPARAGVDGIVIAQAWDARIVQGQQIVVVAETRDWIG